MRKKYQSEPSLSPIKSEAPKKIILTNLLADKNQIPNRQSKSRQSGKKFTKKSPISNNPAARFFVNVNSKDTRMSFENAVRKGRKIGFDNFEK